MFSDYPFYCGYSYAKFGGWGSDPKQLPPGPLYNNWKMGKLYYVLLKNNKQVSVEIIKMI